MFRGVCLFPFLFVLRLSKSGLKTLPVVYCHSDVRRNLSWFCWNDGLLENWDDGFLGVFVVLPLSDFRSLTGGALMLRVMCLIFLFVFCVPGSGCPASD